MAHDVRIDAGWADERWRRGSFFRMSGQTFLPLPDAGSGWRTAQLRGPAISGLLARAVEQVTVAEGCEQRGLRPARWNLDLFRATPMQPCAVTTAVARQGRRVCIVDANLTQNGQTYARASALYVAGSDEATGPVWAPADKVDPPPRDLVPTVDDGWVMSVAESDWTSDVASIPHGVVRRQSWHRPLSIVEGEEPSPFQMLAATADFANVVVNWGECGLQYINADLNIAVARLPRRHEVGVRSTMRIENSGVAIGVAQLFDRDGVLGVVSLAALANVQRAVDPRTKRPFAEGVALG